MDNEEIKTLKNGKYLDFEIFTTMILQRKVTNKNIILTMIKGYSITIEKIEG